MMKKLLMTTGLLLGLNGLCSAQNMFTVKLDDDVCLNELEVQYSDMSKETLPLGCGGGYQFDTGQNTVDVILINGSVCKEGESEVIIDGKAFRSINDSKKSIFSIIK